VDPRRRHRLRQIVAMTIVSDTPLAAWIDLETIVPQSAAP
jgi:hypothetical protein